ncbi:hypothetical protein ASPCADRAFT_157234 [Aspergillus carbonarius ITEM 5010]|uniref:Uncharacterized protein n=1 Tax=Aspergillus carbonarius (strain ITEM 5010) TaxID=602072 RepID=A0A1R3R6V3_ASPC5|nr:hypothetical protein ASPCADRAFT_157234 [Aspergillus carbonarius ITEM 5010]
MRFTPLIFVVLATGPLAALAAPTPSDNKEDAALSCPDGAKIHCGDCNGTSCRIGFTNYGMDIALVMRASALPRVEVAMGLHAGITTSVVPDTLFVRDGARLRLEEIYMI